MVLDGEQPVAREPEDDAEGHHADNRGYAYICAHGEVGKPDQHEQAAEQAQGDRANHPGERGTNEDEKDEQWCGHVAGEASPHTCV